MQETIDEVMNEAIVFFILNNGTASAFLYAQQAVLFVSHLKGIGFRKHL